MLGGDTMQQVSWFDSGGRPSNGSTVIAQIFFQTNETKLDLVDRIVITKLAQYARAELRARGKADFVIVGRADHRGDVKYNQRLGAARASGQECSKRAPAE
jgi:outer membrane protein OmpA-like peptidoglycan-associated protein